MPTDTSPEPPPVDETKQIQVPKALHSKLKILAANAGRPDNWWGIVTRHGEPVIQGANDPAPGCYVSTTSL